MLDRKLLVGCLVGCGILVLVYAVTITAIFAIQNRNSTESQHQIVKCETYGCLQTAAQIVSYINGSIDPCDNFYQFANGHYINEMTDETEEDVELNFYSTASQLMDKRIGRLLSEPLYSNEWKPFKLAKSFYRSCLNQSEITVNSENQQLIHILRQFGGWPVVQGKFWLSRKFDLIELIRVVNDLGFDTKFLFELDIHSDIRNKTNQWLRVCGILCINLIRRVLLENWRALSFQHASSLPHILWFLLIHLSSRTL